MDWSTITEVLLKGIGSLAATLIITLASILFAKLKSKINEAKLNSFIDKTVKAAEQLFPNLGNKTGKEKYDYVVQQVLSKFPKLENNQYLSNLIEGAVYAVSEQIKQIKETNKEEIKTITKQEEPVIKSF